MAIARHQILGVIIWAPFIALRHAARLAVRIYGPFGLHSLPLQLGLSASRGDPPREVLPGGEVIDIVLQRILTARTLLAAGLLTLLVQTTFVLEWDVEWLGNWAVDTMSRGLLAMIFAPFLVLLGIGLLAVTARPDLRRATLRAGAEPARLALVTLAILAILVLIYLDTEHGGPISGFLTWVTSSELSSSPFFIALVMLPTLVGLCWIGSFLVSAVYLTQRNGLSRRRTLPLLPPMVLTVLTLMVSLSGVDGSDSVGGWREVLHRYGPPLAVAVLSALEVRMLRRKYGYTFRSPVRAEPDRRHQTWISPWHGSPS